MAYSVMVFAARKPGISHDEFKSRYERHMRMVTEIAGDNMPLKHTRWYPRHEGADDKPTLLAGSAERMRYDVIVEMSFKDEAAFGRFHRALLDGEANARILEDEAGFWDRERMEVVVIGEVQETKK
ncbi:hypothetical protein jhhlp_000152 [Lomentospora prolificans]|uniref:EthD domain-containing protein n=1 Tax=Lomentospora prolificans TaxID=41688 RepID=A0A2N3NLU4_9PEZI|nr:hypothetical protein jhhlp_000152 [Lomentospora prolificans]